MHDQSGKPLAGVLVRLESNLPRSAVSNSNGRFAFVNVTPGSYTLTYTKSGYRTVVLHRVHIGPNSLLLATVTLSPSTTTLKIIGSVVSRERLPFNSTPAALKVFPREAYRDQGQAALATVLNQTPGAIAGLPSQQNFAQPDGPYFGTIRGGLPWETAILIDGNEVALPSSGTFNLAYIPSFLLQDVEVAKGYGSVETTMGGAIDGALNLRTADPGVARKGMLEVEADSRGGQFSDFAYGGTAPNGRLSYATMLAVDGNPGPASGTGAAGEALQRAELFKAHYAFSDAVDGTFSFVGSQGTLGDAVTRGFALPSGFGSFANSIDARESHRLGIYAVELHAHAAGNDISAKAYDMRLQRTNGYDAFAFPAIGSGLDSVDDVLGFSLQDDRSIGGNPYQLQVSHRSGQAQASICPLSQACAILIPSGARSDETMFRAAALLHAGKATDLQISGAALWLRERYSNDGGARYTDHTAFSPVVHAGAAFHVRPTVTVRVSAGTGVVAPPASVLNSDPAPAILQTPIGLPAREVSQTTTSVFGTESSFGYDAGAEYRLHGDTTTLSADAYRTITHDAYMDANSLIPAWRYTWMNAPSMTHQGLELSLQQFKRVGLGFIAQLALMRDYANLAPPYFFGTSNLAVVPGANLSGGSPFLAGANDVAALRIPYAQGYSELELQMAARFARINRRPLRRIEQSVCTPGVRAIQREPRTLAGVLFQLQISVQNLTNIYGDALPTAFAGVPVALAPGGFALVNAGVVGPRTIRFMFRQSIGGSIFER